MVEGSVVAGIWLRVLLLQEPSQYCSSETALQLAVAAYKRAAALTPFGTPVLGLGASCSLVTVRCTAESCIHQGL
jgi:hypothetical protein